MTVKVYVDVLFIINFIADYILLSVTAFFIKRKVSYSRLVLSSSFGALYSVISFFMNIEPICLFLFSLTVAFIMIFLCFGIKSCVLLLKTISVFYIVSLCTAGLGFSLLLMQKNKNFLIGSGFFYADINAYTLLFVFIVSVMVIHISCGFIKKQRIKSSYLYTVAIEKNGKSVTATALFDTGNFLKEPFSQKSVIVAEWKTVSSLFKNSTLSECIANNPHDFLYIPCKVLGGKSGLFAFIPDKIKSEGVLLQKEVLVAVTETHLDTDETYSIILPNDFNSLERM